MVCLVVGRFQVIPAAYVLLRRDDEVLLQLRQHTGYRDGYWACAAAGHVELGESVFDAAVREAREEIGVELCTDDLVPLTAMHRTHRNDDPIDERVDIFFECRRWTGEPAVLEPRKNAGLRWARLDDLPDPVVPHERFVLDSLLRGNLPAVVTFGF